MSEPACGCPPVNIGPRHGPDCPARNTPAFPVPMITTGEGYPKFPGVSRRELAAMFALQGLISRSIQPADEEGMPLENIMGHRVRKSIRYADALLAALAADKIKP